ncbi:TPA: TraY domain-containing protein [Legionella pneumophila]|nr:TraY domain-containing protein [Legionella pneumophila]HBD7345090.1 TraY domain-containing protein [Legionella pneumophila]HBD7346457.1 TraY domain-containing protein [Legionella pneumophila]HCX3438631.1 TraY domain-containing protein [Legionella pneumophila]HCX3439764.1 TraY domain-containing protein [Legionella pneumophila]
MKLKSDNHYKKVYITLLLSEESNRLLSESSERSSRKKIQEATLRLEDHLAKYRSISELHVAIPKENSIKRCSLSKAEIGEDR